MSRSWRPIALEELQAEIKQAELRMSVGEYLFWIAIRIDPEKWACSPYGDEGEGFWAVGIFGRRVLWYNDIEDGFNHSRYGEFGRIHSYMCEQSDLRDVIRSILDCLDGSGVRSGRFGPPRSSS